MKIAVILLVATACAFVMLTLLAALALGRRADEWLDSVLSEKEEDDDGQHRAD